MTTGVLVSCIRADLVNNCLQSLAKQSRKPDNIIVVLRGSDINSQRAIDAFGKIHLGINIKKVIVTQPGAVMAVNAGIKNSTGEILCFIDDDAQAETDWLKRIEAHYADEKIGGVGGRDILHIDGKIIERRVKYIGRISWYGKIIGNHHHAIDKEQKAFHLKGCNMSYRRKLLSLLDEKLSANRQMAEPYWEIELGFMMSRRGYATIYDPDIIVKHYPAISDEDWGRRRSVSIHNETYILLKYFSVLRKFIYILYIFLIGHESNLGFIKYIMKSFHTLNFKGASEQFLADMKSKTKGIKDYLDYLRKRK